MTDRITPAVLHQRWVHSHEEDSGREMVFRPAWFKFPPSRGRASFDLKADGSLIEGGPGPCDRRVESDGRWKLEGDGTLTFFDGADKTTTRVLRVVSAAIDRLVVEQG